MKRLLSVTSAGFLTVFVILVSGILFVLSGCSSDASLSGDGLIRSSAMLGPEKAYAPIWSVGDYWVIKQEQAVGDKTTIRYFVVLVENKTFINVTIPYTAQENDLNIRSLYLRRAETFSELVSRRPEGDNWVSGDVYVVGRYEPIKLVPVYDSSGCSEPEEYRLDFFLDVLKKELAYSQQDLSLVWDPDSPGRQLKMFHWPLRTGKYWSFPVINIDSEEGRKFVRQKVSEGQEQGYDFKEYQVFAHGAVVDYDVVTGRFVVELSGLYPFFANYDKKEMTFWYDPESRFWDWNVHSDLAGVKVNLTESVVLSGHVDLSPDAFDDRGIPFFLENLTDVVDYRLSNPNYTLMCRHS